MELNKEQNRVLKAMTGAGLGVVAGTILYYVCSSKLLESWTDALILSVLNLFIIFVVGTLFVFGSKIPKKDD